MLDIYLETDCDIDVDSINKVFEEVKAHFSLPTSVSAELTVVDGDTIRETNFRLRGVDAVTDVLSFPSVDVSLPFDEADYQYDIDPCDGKITLGEIMLCYSRMEEQSVEYGHSKERECCYLVLHGLLHLLGFDHMEEADKNVMRAQEEAILGKLGIVRE